MAPSYRVSCPACGAAWSGLQSGEKELGPGEARARVTCSECSTGASAVVRRTAAEVTRYRRDILKTVREMRRGYHKARSRIDRRLAAPNVSSGIAKRLKGRLAAMRPPDTPLLDERARMLGEIMPQSPAEPEEVPCAACGGATTVFGETRNGFEVPCPKCAARLDVVLTRFGRAPE